MTDNIKKISEDNIWYRSLKIYVDWCTRTSYSKTEVIGLENIPDDGAVILAPNHCNALMDALVVLKTRKGATLFGARADIFKNKKAAHALHFIKILPMVRQRDGLRNVLQNKETNKIIVDSLEKGTPFCIFPEGRHRPMHSILSLGKGTQRIAFEAYEKFGDKKPIYIVPIGLEYGDYFRYRSTSSIEFGRPVNVTDIIKRMEGETEPVIIREIGKEITEGIAKLITYLPDDETYEQRWELVKITTAGVKGPLIHSKHRRKEVIDDLLRLEQEKPEEMKALYEDVLKFREERKKHHISNLSFGARHLAGEVIFKTLFSIISIPYYLYSIILTLPMWLTAHLISGKIKDPSFLNTVHFGVKLAALPLMTIIWTVLAFCFLPWYLAIAAILLAIPSYSFVYDAKEYLRRYISDIKCLCRKDLRTLQRSIVERFKAMSGN